MTSTQKPMTILVCTYNAESKIERCLESIYNQTDCNFEVKIADSNSEDGTLEIINRYKRKYENLEVISEVDRGIYDGLNKLIRRIKTKYYLVLGADDYIHEDAIKDYNDIIKDEKYDLVTFPVLTKKGKLYPRNNQLRYGQLAHISQHSVGVLIKKDLHNAIGFYDTNFTIGADALFILSAINKGASIYKGQEVVGYYSLMGMSSTNYLHNFFEFSKVQLLTNKNFLLSFLAHIIRQLIHYNKIKKIHDEYLERFNK